MTKYSMMLITALMLLANCKKDESPAPQNLNQTKFLIVSMDPNDPNAGVISIYDSYGVQKVANSFSERICDVVIKDDKIYAVSIYNSVKILDLSTLEVIKSIPIEFTGNYHKHIDFVGNKIVVADWGMIIPSPNQYPDYESFLRVIDPTTDQADSIAVVMDQDITGLAHINNKIIVPGAKEYLKEAITTFDATSNAKVDQIDIDGSCTDILMDKEDNILAFLYGSILKLNNSDLSLVNKIPFDGYGINWSGNGATRTNSNSFALDKEENILYYFTLAGQPAAAPYVLKSYNLNTNSSAVLNNTFMDGLTISLDQKNKRILIGVDAGVNFYTTEGEFRFKMPVPLTPSEIIVLQ